MLDELLEMPERTEWKYFSVCKFRGYVGRVSETTVKLTPYVLGMQFHRMSRKSRKQYLLVGLREKKGAHEAMLFDRGKPAISTIPLEQVQPALCKVFTGKLPVKSSRMVISYITYIPLFACS